MQKRIVATHLYDFATCEHRVGLDFSLDRSMRTPLDDAARLLAERGLRVEASIAGRLGYVTVAPRPEDPEAAFRDTVESMRRGVAGIYQGVLLTGRYLAIPDLLRRADGHSDLGGFHYVPGDIKSGLTPRADQALQVVFAARLLERIQGRRPEVGSLVMGDGREEAFRIEDLWDSATLALSSIERIADGDRETSAFLSDGCARCRWRGACLPELQQGPDLSFVAGMTRTKKRLLERCGLHTVANLAAFGGKGIEALAANGLATDGLRALQKQAEALASGKRVVRGRRGRGEPPAKGSREHFLVAGWDVLGEGEPFLIGWASRPWGSPVDRCEVRLVSDGPARVELGRDLAGWIGGEPRAIFHYGSSARRAFDRLSDRAGLAGQLQGMVEARFFDLAPLVRAGAYLPVRRYRLNEVAAVLAGHPLPPVEEPEDAPFVWFENRRLGVEGDWEGRLRDRARRDLDSLAAVRDWTESSTA